MAGHLEMLAFIQNIGGPEWMVILIIALLIFGRRLPEVARSLGKSVNEFKKGMQDFQNSANEVANDVNHATREAMADSETYTPPSYEDPAASYDSHTTDEPAGAADASAAADQAASVPAADDSHPDKTATSGTQPADSFPESMS